MSCFHIIQYEQNGKIFRHSHKFFGCDKACFFHFQDVDVALARRGNRRTLSNCAQHSLDALYNHRRRTDSALAQDCGSKRKPQKTKFARDGFDNYGVLHIGGNLRAVFRTGKKNISPVFKSRLLAYFLHYASHPFDVNAVCVFAKLVLGAQEIRCVFVHRTRRRNRQNRAFNRIYGRFALLARRSAEHCFGNDDFRPCVRSNFDNTVFPIGRTIDKTERIQGFDAQNNSPFRNAYNHVFGRVFDRLYSAQNACKIGTYACGSDGAVRQSVGHGSSAHHGARSVYKRAVRGVRSRRCRIALKRRYGRRACENGNLYAVCNRHCVFVFCGLFAARAKPRLASFQRQRGGQVRVLLFVYALSNRHGASDHAYAKLARQRAKHTSQHDCGSGGNDSVRAVYAKIHRRVRNGALNRHLLFSHCDFKSDSPQKRSRLVYQPQEKRAYDFAFRSAFNVVDVTACVKMFAPSHEKPAKITRKTHKKCKEKREKSLCDFKSKHHTRAKAHKCGLQKSREAKTPKSAKSA